MINLECCTTCHNFNSCETKWLRGERQEKQICCPHCESFHQCNSNFPAVYDPNYDQALKEIIQGCVSTNSFISAHCFALLLPLKDFSAMKFIRHVYIYSYEHTMNQNVLTEGVALLNNVFSKAERAELHINLAYFYQFFDPDQANQLAITALAEGSPINLVVKFYTWLRHPKRAGSAYLNRLLKVSREAKNQELEILTTELHQIISLDPKDPIEFLQMVENIDHFILKFRNILEIKVLRALTAPILNNACQNLKNLGDNCAKSFKIDDAFVFYQAASKGYRLFTELKPSDPANYGNTIILLNKLQEIHLKNSPPINPPINDQIKSLFKNMEVLLPQYRNWQSTGLVIAKSFIIYASILNAEGCDEEAKAYFLKAIEHFEKVSNSPQNFPGTSKEMSRLQQIALGKGECLTKLGRYEDALTTYKDTLEKYPDWFEGHFWKGNTFIEMGKDEEAELEYTKCIELDKRMEGAIVLDRLIIFYTNKEKYKEAIDCSKKLLRSLMAKSRVSKLLDWNFFRLARLYEDAGGEQLAIKIFKHIIEKRQPNHPEAHARLSKLYMRNMDWENAIKVLLYKVNIEGNIPFSDYCYLGDCYKNIGQDARALEFYIMAHNISHRALPVLFRLAKYFEERNISRAIEYITAIIEVAPPEKAADDYIWRGDLWNKQGNSLAAEDDYLRALELAPSSERARQRSVSLALSSGIDLRNQIDHLERTLEKIPFDQNLSRSLINKYVLSNDPANTQKALSQLEKGYSSETPEYYEVKAQIVKDLSNNLAEAIRCRSKMSELPSITADKHINNFLLLLEWSLEAQKPEKEWKSFLDRFEKLNSNLPFEQSVMEMEKARKTFELVADYYLNDGNYYKTLKYANLLIEEFSAGQKPDKKYLTTKGRALINLNRLSEADAIFDTILAHYPSDSYAFFYKGEIHRKRGNSDIALGHFYKSKDLSKDAQGIISALNRVVKISYFRKDYARVIDDATQLLELDPDDLVIQTYRGLSYLALDRKEKAISDFGDIFRGSPSDVPSARKFIQAYPLAKGDHNDPDDIIRVLELSSHHKFKCNIIDRLCELSIFPENPLRIVDPLLRQYRANELLSKAIAHYLSRYAIYSYFQHQEGFVGRVREIICWFNSFSDVHLFKLLFAEFVGAEKGAFLEFLAQRYEKEFAKIDQILASIDPAKPANKGDLRNIQQRIQELQYSIGGHRKFSTLDGEVVCLQEEFRTSINRLRAHYVHIDFSLPDAKPLFIEADRADLMIETFERIAEIIADDVESEKLLIECKADDEHIGWGIWGSNWKGSEKIRGIFGEAQRDGVQCALSRKESSFVIVAQTDKRDFPKPLPDLLQFQRQSFKSFLHSRKNPGYWKRIHDAIGSLVFNDPISLEECVRYVSRQICDLAKLSKEDFQKCIGPYHEIKNKIKLVIFGEQFTEEGQQRISKLRLRQQGYLRTLRFPDFEYFAFREFITETTTTFQKLKGVSLRIDHSEIDNDYAIYADKVSLGDCIGNLIFNAYNAIKKKGKSGSEGKYITVKFLRANEYLVITCADNGCGMSPEDIEQFKSGTSGGIGMQCILHAVDIHDGELDIKSEVGEGTEFKIIIYERKEK